MSHPIDPSRTAQQDTKRVVRKIVCPDHGTVWRVTYPCGCHHKQFRQHAIALIFATHHTCPQPWVPLPARCGTIRQERT